MLPAALKVHDEKILVLYQRKMQKVVLEFFAKAQERFLNNIHLYSYEIIEQTAVKEFFTGTADELFIKITRLSKFQDSTSAIMSYLHESLTFKISMTMLIKQHAEIAVFNEAKFREDNIG